MASVEVDMQRWGPCIAALWEFREFLGSHVQFLRLGDRTQYPLNLTADDSFLQIVNICRKSCLVQFIFFSDL